MDLPPPQNSKTRVLQVGGSSSSSMDAEVVEIPPPAARLSKALKQKEVLVHEVINIDSDDDVADSVIIKKELNIINKGKSVIDLSDGYHNGYSKEYFDDHIYISDDCVGPMNGAEPKGLEEGSHTPFNGDEQLYEPSHDVDDYMDYLLEDVVQIDDDYDLLQAHFDSMDIPPGVEAAVPWLPGMSKNESISYAGSSVNSSGSALAETTGQASSASDLPQFDLATTWLSFPSAPSKKNRGGFQHKPSNKNFSFGLETFKSRRLVDSFRNKKSPVSSSNSTNYSSPSQLAGSQQPYGVDPSSWVPGMHIGAKTLSVSSSFSSIPPPVSGSSAYQSFPQQIFSQVKASKADKLQPLWKTSSHFYGSGGTSYSYVEPMGPGVHVLPEEDVSHSSSGDRLVEISDALTRFETFKRFDTVQDHSDHHYSKDGSSAKQPSKNWAKRIQDEWRSLEKDLPETIFVRVYEERMDLLRAVIVGAEGTPYHDGLYFFDVCFPPGYPHNPPLVYYHSRGLRLNPNLYNSGKVCLSLLNTWSGQKNEKWMPNVSTMLQVLVSIQGLILNEKPYFNEPGCACLQGSRAGEEKSFQYNNGTFILSLRTMTYVLRTPPKHFEDFVTGHFFHRAERILAACKAYTEGAQVGSLTNNNGGVRVQDVGAGYKSGFATFKETVKGYIKILAKEFMKMGVKDCHKFLPSLPHPPLPPPAKETTRSISPYSAADDVTRFYQLEDGYTFAAFR